jgi:pSer/pThr/pTyr-binding forkhead associated (FHA) protein
MAKIIIHTDQNGTEEMLLTEGTVTIGRTKDNDIQIDDPAVSAYHAKLVSFFKPTYIQDLRSTNGTYVNGSRVMEHTLEHGDIITIGKHNIYFSKESGFASAPDAPDHTVELSVTDISLILKNEKAENNPE